MNVSRIFSFLLLAVCLAPSLFAQQSEEAKKLDEFLSHLEAHDKFMGSVTVIKDGKQLFSKAYGQFTQQDESGKSTTETKYRIGSITKTFTATMIMQLVEAKKLSLDDKLSKYFPEPKNADQITIDNLLRHRSGLGNLTAQADYLGWNKSAKTRDEMMEKILKCPTDFEPDERMEYSNTNFILLGFILEDITGKSYGEILKSQIATPLKLANTYMGKKAEASENEAISFSYSNSKWIPEAETHMSIPHGAGAIVSTTEDLTKFMTALINKELVNAESLEKMISTERMGRGLMKFPFNGKTAVGHNGGIDGFQSNLAHFKEGNVTLSICGNGVVYPFNDVLIGVLSCTFGTDFKLPSFETADVAEDLLKRYEGVYSSKKFPLKITVAVKNGQLTGQATGQGAFPLAATSETEFSFDTAKIKMSFSESKADKGFDEMNFSQGPMKVKFTKEK